jgi:hypothetical protein
VDQVSGLERPAKGRTLGIPKSVLVHLGSRRPHGDEFLIGGGQGDLDRGDLAEPALFLGLAEPVDEVGVDGLQPWHLGWVNPKQWASDTGLTEMILLVWTQASPRQLFTESAQKVCCRRDLGRVAEVGRSSHGRRK